MKSRLSAIIVLLLMILPLKAERLHFNNISTDAGLSNKMVLSIVQDRDGYIWMATAEGLDRYDGSSFKVFRHVPGDETTLGASWINEVKITRDGRLLVATEMGLYVFNHETETFSPFPVVNNKDRLMSKLRFKCLYEDDSNIWCGTSDGLVKIDKVTGYMDFMKIAASSSDDRANEINSMTCDSDGKFWIATFDGLYLFDRNNFDRRRFEVRDLHIFDQKNNYISSVLNLPSDEGHLYIGTSNGLAIMDIHDYSCRYFREETSDLCNNDIKSIGIYDESHLLICTSNGLSVYDIKNSTFDNYAPSLMDRNSLPHETIWCSYEDKMGIVWIGTSNGVSKINKNLKSIEDFKVFSSYKGQVKEMMVSDIAVMSGGEIWVGTTHGIQVYDKDMNPLRRYELGVSGLPHNNIKRLTIDSRGYLWVGTNDGIAYFDPHRDHFVKVVPDNESIHMKYIYDIKEDSKGDMVVNISNGICLITPRTSSSGAMQSFSFKAVRIDSMVSSENTDVSYMDTDKHGNIWFGTINDGLFTYNVNTAAIKQYMFNPKDDKSINSNRIYSIHVDSKSAVWVGTDMGLCRLEPATGEFTRFQDDLDLSKSIRTITSDKKGRLWTCLLDKIVMFDYQYNRKIICDVRLDQDCDELEYNSFCNSGDFIYFGGYGNVIKLDTKSIEVSLRKAPVRITSYTVSGQPSKPFPSEGKLVLRPSENSVSFSFALLDFSSETNNKYVYILEGYDQQWKSTDNSHNVASYANLPAGHYTFKVIGSNPDGVFNDMLSVSVVVVRNWWARWWAWLFYVVAFASLLLIGVMQVRGRLRLKRQLRNEKLERNKIESLNRIKMRFFTSISHEFKTPLSLIIGPVDSLLESVQDDDQRAMLKMMKQNADRMLRLINQILDLRKIDNEKIKLNLSAGEASSFASSVFDSFRENAERRNISYDFISGEEVYCEFDKDKLENILYNLLSNAFKFTPDGGSIQLSVSRRQSADGDAAEFSVIDSGQGMSPEEMEHIFDRFYQGSATSYEKISSTGIGLGLTKEFVELHGGTIEVKSEKGKGSVFTFWIPCNMNVQTDEGETAHGVDGELTGRRMVVIDDNPDILSFIKLNMKDSFDVRTALSGEEGLKLVIETCPDLVVTDVMMPDLDGLEICRRIKSDALTSHIPVIVLTAKSGDSDMADGYRSGADGYLTKPFSIKVLKAKADVLVSSREKLKEHFRQRIQLVSDAPAAEEPESKDDKFMSMLVSDIEANLDNAEYSVQDLCNDMPYSYLQIYRKVKAMTGITINELMRSIRLRKAAQYLENTDMRISEVMYGVGFSTHSYFTRCFKDIYGLTPTEYAAKHRECKEEDLQED